MIIASQKSSAQFDVFLVGFSGITERPSLSEKKSTKEKGTADSRSIFIFELISIIHSS